MVDIDSDGDADSQGPVGDSQPAVVPALADSPPATAELVLQTSAVPDHALHEAVFVTQHVLASPPPAHPGARAESHGAHVQPCHQLVTSTGNDSPAEQAAAQQSPEAEPRLDPARAAACRRTFRRFGKQQAAFDCADRC